MNLISINRVARSTFTRSVLAHLPHDQVTLIAAILYGLSRLQHYAILHVIAFNSKQEKISGIVVRNVANLIITAIF